VSGRAENTRDGRGAGGASRRVGTKGKLWKRKTAPGTARVPSGPGPATRDEGGGVTIIGLFERVRPTPLMVATSKAGRHASFWGPLHLHQCSAVRPSPSPRHPPGRIGAHQAAVGGRTQPILRCRPKAAGNVRVGIAPESNGPPALIWAAGPGITGLFPAVTGPAHRYAPISML